MSSEEGLNAYGAVTWGQFFIYQGFNENCGWMHTSSNVDVADMYAEKIITRDRKNDHNQICRKRQTNSQNF
jgi:acyl-homoserine lactone acylase PvdQ